MPAPLFGPVLVAVARQEVAGVQIDRRPISCGFPVPPRRRRGVLEGFDVHPYSLLGTQNDLFTLPAQISVALGGQDPAGGVQGAPQVVVRRASFQLWPQGIHYLLAVQAVTGCDGE